VRHSFCQLLRATLCVLLFISAQSLSANEDDFGATGNTFSVEQSLSIDHLIPFQSKTQKAVHEEFKKAVADLHKQFQKALKTHRNQSPQIIERRRHLQIVLQLHRDEKIKSLKKAKKKGK